MTFAPLLSSIDPTIWLPTTAWDPAGPVQVVTAVLPPLREPEETAAVPAYATPPKVRVQLPVRTVLAVPMFCSPMVQTSGVPEHE